MNTALTFCYQLQGFAEIGNQPPNIEQWANIVVKLDTVSIEDLIIETDNMMAQETFIVWLKGYVDLAAPTEVNEREWQIIKDHLQLVFTKVTPNYEDEDDEHFPEVSKNIKDALEQWQSTDMICDNIPTLKKPDKACSSRHKRIC